MYGIQYNGIKDTDIGVLVVSRPSIPAPEPKVTVWNIAGRDGSLYSSDDLYDDIQIFVELNFMAPVNEWAARARQIKQWLLDRKKDRRLYLSDDMSFFYKVKNVSVGEITRSSKRIGNLTPMFTCDPYMYLTSGLTPIKWTTMDLNLQNPYSLSKPKYIITGQSTVNISVNDADVVADVNGELTIDTDLMIAYTNDGTLKNAAIDGDYEQLWLPSGKNKVYISGEGNPTMDIIPNWRTP